MSTSTRRFNPFTLMNALADRLERDANDFEIPPHSINAVVALVLAVRSVVEQNVQGLGSALLPEAPQEPTPRAKGYTLTLNDFLNCLQAVLAEEGIALDETQLSHIMPHAISAHCTIGQQFDTIRPGMGVSAWLATDEVGLSSRFMVTYLHPDLPTTEYAHPLDVCDFRRCMKALIAIPKLRDDLVKLTPVSLEWEQLIQHWDVISMLIEGDALQQARLLIDQCLSRKHAAPTVTVK